MALKKDHYEVVIRLNELTIKEQQKLLEDQDRQFYKLFSMCKELMTMNKGLLAEFNDEYMPESKPLTTLKLIRGGLQA